MGKRRGEAQHTAIERVGHVEVARGIHRQPDGAAQARLRTETVMRLAEQACLPFLHEYVVGQHIVLYAHSEVEVVLLALKHQRQLTYSADQ